MVSGAKGSAGEEKKPLTAVELHRLAREYSEAKAEMCDRALDYRVRSIVEKRIEEIKNEAGGSWQLEPYLEVFDVHRKAERIEERLNETRASLAKIQVFVFCVMLLLVIVTMAAVLIDLS